jgi:hypothetical protein
MVFNSSLKFAPHRLYYVMIYSESTRRKLSSLALELYYASIAKDLRFYAVVAT